MEYGVRKRFFQRCPDEMLKRKCQDFCENVISSISDPSQEEYGEIRAPFAVFLGIDNGENEAYNIVKRGRV